MSADKTNKQPDPWAGQMVPAQSYAAGPSSLGAAPGSAPACSLKRYDPVEYHDQGGRSYGHMRAEPDGDFVEYVEYERLRAEMEAAYQLLIKRRPIDAEQHLRVVLTSLPNTQAQPPKVG